MVTDHRYGSAPMRHHPIAAVLVAGALVLAACSSDSGSDASTPADEATTSTIAAPDRATAIGAGHNCDQGALIDDLEVAEVAGTPADRDLTSFDGTKIRLHWFPVEGASADDPKPVILMGPGWSLPGDSDPEGGALFSALSIKGLWEHGYNVLTWDPRGFGKSEGVASVNAADIEGRDVRALLDFVAAQPEVELDDDGDPRAGMVGFSYGGGIQLVTAAIDCRVDAIVPGIAWHSLETSLYKAETVKTGWSTVLTSTVDKTRLDPHVVSASESGLRDGSLSDEDRQWFIDRGPGDELVGRIDVPTLLIGGTVDTLFTLDEDLTNLEILRANGVPAAMLWFCGGHGTCLTDPGDTDRIATASFAWLDRYLKGDEDAEVLPLLDLVDQDGDRWTGEEPFTPFDIGDGTGMAWSFGGATSAATSEGSGTLELTEASRSGGSIEGADPNDLLAGVVAAITPTEADVALELNIDVSGMDDLAIGSPVLEMTYSGTLPEGETDGRVFAQLVDDEAGVVIGNQITPIALVLDGEEHTLTVPLEVIAQDLSTSGTITLQLVATTTAYATPPLGGTLDVRALSISLPLGGDAVTPG
jgi:ABC-2 type transport system ATP-binding protein